MQTPGTSPAAQAASPPHDLGLAALTIQHTLDSNSLEQAAA